MKTYKGKYTPKNKEKYIGDYKNIVYRSFWERQTFKWVDENPNILEWNSEEVVVPYVCSTDNKVHRYFIDLYLKTKDGKRYLIEIKPKSQTAPPKTPKRKTKRYIQESLTYIKNQDKWKAASSFAADNNCVFQIWTEDTLKGLGIKIIK
jgi:hypothetical protein